MPCYFVKHSFAMLMKKKPALGGHVGLRAGKGQQ